MAQNDERVVRVTLEDLDKVTLPDASSATVTPGAGTGVAGARSYGNINAAEPGAPTIDEQKGSVLLQGWFYLGAAGLIGAAAGWGICEPHFVDGMRGEEAWGNYCLIPLTLLLMLTAFAVAESMVERSMRKALRRALVIPLGLIGGFIFDRIANIGFAIGVLFIRGVGVDSYRNPAFWIVRGLAWSVFGVAGGLIYGLIGQSGKKAKYGIIGGMVGAGLGGVIFDPIAMMVGNNAVLSRFVGFSLLGLATGAAIGFVESALKDRWIYVSAGPLAGKQFILYKPQTTIGSSQQSDIYLFKDTSISPQHAVLETRGNQVMLRATQPVYVSGVPTQARVLMSGDVIQIGRYQFRYNERQRQ